MTDRTFHIISLITKELYGEITAEEKSELESWRADNPGFTEELFAQEYSAVVNEMFLYNKEAMRTELDKIRTGLAGTGAMVFTYTYKPLIGMTSETDPSGKTIYYEYDNHGRLIHVKDSNFNIIKKYSYSHAGPQ